MTNDTRFDSLQTRIQGVEAMLANGANNAGALTFSQRLARTSLDYHLSDLRAQELGFAFQTVAAREPLEVRLIGASVNNGTTPTELISKILKDLSSALHRAVNKITTGNDSQKPSNMIKDMLDLRFSGLQPGSSRIFLSASSSGDLAGNITQQTFNDIFDVFESDSEEAFIEKTAIIGSKSLSNFHGLVNVIYAAGLDLELSWPSQSNHRVRVWRANREELHRFKERCISIDVRDSKTVEHEGHISLVSDTGQLRIRLDDGSEIMSTFGPDLLEQVRAHGVLGQRVRVSLREDSIGNSRLNILKYTYSLLEFL